MSITKDQIIEAVSSMSVLEIVELISEMEKKFSVSATTPVVVNDTSSAEDTEEKTEFDVILQSIGSNKVAVIKAVRSATGLGLKESKDLVESAPTALIKASINKNEAEALKKSLEEIGAKVEIK